MGLLHEILFCPEPIHPIQHLLPIAVPEWHASMMQCSVTPVRDQAADLDIDRDQAADLDLDPDQAADQPVVVPEGHNIRTN